MPIMPVSKHLLDMSCWSARSLKKNLWAFAEVAPKKSSWDDVSREASHALIYLNVRNSNLF